MRFFLGVPEAAWMPRTRVPLFVSHTRLLRRRRSLPQPQGPWALDSGGFTELSKYGGWMTSPEEYVKAVARYATAGKLQWAAPQDWMCEPHMLAKTGLTVEEHQVRTVANYLWLTSLAPELPFIPVLQGWDFSDYLRCVELYLEAGIDLTQLPLTGLGSVCRRQNTSEIARITSSLAGLGIRLHGFGVKKQGLARYAHNLVSADSMAWSFGARRGNIRLPDCDHAGPDCRNCLRWALRWRKDLINELREEQA